ncbi:hypothetical protein [Agromyces bauzanensis]
MLIALLVVLGVNLVVIVALIVFVRRRRRWVAHQPGAFQGAVRVQDGEVDGFSSKWTRGYGRWVREVLVWTKAPLLLSNETLATDALVGRRRADATEVTKLGEEPIVVRVEIGAGAVEVAARADDANRVVGPYGAARAQP